MKTAHEADAPSGALLAIDTATSQCVVAVQAARDASVISDRWPSGHVHGERLLASIVEVLGRAGLALGDVWAVAVGTGPGSFTGLRVGLATAKGLTFGLSVPIIGIPTAEALARASVIAGRSTDGRIVVLQPAGPSGRYRTVVERTGVTWRTGPPELLPSTDGDDQPASALGVLAVDLPDAPGEARSAGRLALERLADALVLAARERLASGASDDLAELVPAYVTLPRGAAASSGSIEWSRGRP